jgi:hypothetical protein
MDKVGDDLGDCAAAGMAASDVAKHAATSATCLVVRRTPTEAAVGHINRES